MALQCAICLESKSDECTWVAIRACGHIYHTSCLQDAIKFRKMCPLCREPLPGLHGTVRLYPQIYEKQELTQGSLEASPVKYSAELLLLRKELEILKLDLKEARTQLSAEQTKVSAIQSRSKEFQVLASIAEEKYQKLRREHSQVTLELKRKMEIQSSLQAREHRTRLLLDTSLLDDEIERLVADLTALNCPGPNYFSGVLATKNKQLATANSALLKSKKENQALQKELEDLKEILESTEEQPANQEYIEGQPPSPGDEHVISLSSDGETDGEELATSIAEGGQDPLGSRRKSAARPALAAAGPGHSIQAGVASFVRNRSRAQALSRDDATFIVQGPDGMGGRKRVTKGAASSFVLDEGMGTSRAQGNPVGKRRKQSRPIKTQRDGSIQNYFVRK